MSITIKQKLTAALGALLLPVAGMFAQDDYSFSYDEEGDLGRSLSVKAFYAVALEAPAKGMDSSYSDPEIDLGGLTVEYEQDFYSNSSGGMGFSWLGALSLGGGTKDYQYLGELTLVTVEAEFGVNLRGNISDSVSLFVGPRLGLNLLYASAEYDYYYGYHYYEEEEDESKFGVLYGADAGVDIRLGDHSGLSLGVGYRASTAEPLDIEAQSWVRFSVGYKYTF